MALVNLLLRSWQSFRQDDHILAGMYCMLSFLLFYCDYAKNMDPFCVLMFAIYCVKKCEDVASLSVNFFKNHAMRCRVE